MFGRQSDLIAYAITVILMTIAFLIARSGLYSYDQPIAYWLGVAGASLMLVPLAYPFRKYVRWMWVRDLGKMKSWLLSHMVIGILGPFFILLHCTFRSISLNATIALWSMIVVISSGFIGRFLFSRTRFGLKGEQQQLVSFKKLSRLDDESNSPFWFCPYAHKLLCMFESRALADEHAARHWFRLLIVLPIESWLVRFQTQHAINEELRRIASHDGWSYATHIERRAVAKHIVVKHLTLVMRIALYRAWEQLFSLWHIAHIPIVFLLVFSSVIHIAAVHIY